MKALYTERRRSLQKSFAASHLPTSGLQIPTWIYYLTFSGGSRRRWMTASAFAVSAGGSDAKSRSVGRVWCVRVSPAGAVPFRIAWSHRTAPIVAINNSSRWILKTCNFNCFCQTLENISRLNMKCRFTLKTQSPNSSPYSSSSSLDEMLYCVCLSFPLLRYLNFHYVLSAGKNSRIFRNAFFLSNLDKIVIELQKHPATD